MGAHSDRPRISLSSANLTCLKPGPPRCGPRLHNWLDTQGFSNGNLTYRNLMSQNVARFRTRLVKRAEVLAALPPGTAMVSSGERMKQMADRYHSIKLRYGI